MTHPLDEEQILDAVKLLSPQSKRKVLGRLIGDPAALDRIVDRNQERLREICRERGVNWSDLSEEERERLVDQVLHED